MIEINLIPDVKAELLKAQSTRNFIIMVSSIISIAAIVIVVLISGTVFIAQPLIIGSKDGEIKNTFNSLKEKPNLTSTATLQNQLNQIDSLHSGSPVTSRILGQIGTAIQPGGDNAVSYSTIEYSPETNTLSIEGQAPSGYSALETFKKTIAETKIIYREESKGESCKSADLLSEKTGCKSENLTDEDVVTTEQSFGDNEDGVKVLRFKISITLNEKVLDVATKDFSVLTPGRKDATDSKAQIPDDIFKARADEGEDK